MVAAGLDSSGLWLRGGREGRTRDLLPGSVWIWSESGLSGWMVGGFGVECFSAAVASKGAGVRLVKARPGLSVLLGFWGEALKMLIQAPFCRPAGAVRRQSVGFGSAMQLVGGRHQQLSITIASAGQHADQQMVGHWSSSQTNPGPQLHNTSGAGEGFRHWPPLR
jgi:hypothetical protein